MKIDVFTQFANTVSVINEMQVFLHTSMQLNINFYTVVFEH